jgi:broad-specificity NMP kinase
MMKTSVFIIGVPGCGKSTICKALQERGEVAHDLDYVPGIFTRIHTITKEPVGHHDHNLEKIQNATWHCDTVLLKELVRSNASARTYYCGYASNTDDILPLFDTVILLRTSPERVRERLSTRTDNDFAQTEDVREWVISWKDEWEEQMLRKGAAPVDCTGNVEDTVKKILAVTSV